MHNLYNYALSSESKVMRVEMLLILQACRLCAMETYK